MIEIIENKPYLRFGTGDIAMQNATAIVKNDGYDENYTLGVLGLTNQNEQKIGEGSSIAYYTYKELRDNANAFITFKKTESLVVLISQLSELYFIMIGENYDLLKSKDMVRISEYISDEMTMQIDATKDNKPKMEQWKMFLLGEVFDIIEGID